MIGKINGATQNFGAVFTKENKDYVEIVKEQAVKSGRVDEYKTAKRTIMMNFPQGKISKLKSYGDTDVFMFTPNEPVQFVFKKDMFEQVDDSTSALDSYVKLAKAIRKISW